MSVRSIILILISLLFFTNGRRIHRNPTYNRNCGSNSYDIYPHDQNDPNNVDCRGRASYVGGCPEVATGPREELAATNAIKLIQPCPPSIRIDKDISKFWDNTQPGMHAACSTYDIKLYSCAAGAGYRCSRGYVVDSRANVGVDDLPLTMSHNKAGRYQVEIHPHCCQSSTRLEKDFNVDLECNGAATVFSGVVGMVLVVVLGVLML